MSVNFQIHDAGFYGEGLCLFSRYLTWRLGILVSAAFYDAFFVLFVIFCYFSIGLVADSWRLSQGFCHKYEPKVFFLFLFYRKEKVSYRCLDLFMFMFNYALQPLRLIVRSGLNVPTFATRRLHACYHAIAPSGGRWNCGREMSGNFA